MTPIIFLSGIAITMLLIILPSSIAKKRFYLALSFGWIALHLNIGNDYGIFDVPFKVIAAVSIVAILISCYCAFIRPVKEN